MLLLPASFCIIPLKMPELFQICGKWRTGLLGLVWIHDYHQGQGRSGCFMSNHGKKQSVLGLPLQVTLTLLQGANTDNSAGLFRPCPTVVNGVQSKKHAEGWGCSHSGVGDPPAPCISLLIAQSLMEGHNSVTTGVHPSLVKCIYSHQKWLYIAAMVIVLLSNTFC